MTLNVTITASQVSAQPSPTPNLVTNAVTPNANWDTFSKTPAVPSVLSSVISNPGTAPVPVSDSPVTAPSTHDPALIITTADARPNFEWPDGSWHHTAYDVVKNIELLPDGTGPLYQNAGGFGSNQNSGGTGPGQTYNTNSFTPPVGFALVPNNSPYKK